MLEPCEEAIEQRPDAAAAPDLPPEAPAPAVDPHDRRRARQIRGRDQGEPLPDAQGARGRGRAGPGGAPPGLTRGRPPRRPAGPAPRIRRSVATRARSATSRRGVDASRLGRVAPHLGARTTRGEPRCPQEILRSGPASAPAEDFGPHPTSARRAASERAARPISTSLYDRYFSARLRLRVHARPATTPTPRSWPRRPSSRCSVDRGLLGPLDAARVDLRDREEHREQPPAAHARRRRRGPRRRAPSRCHDSREWRPSPPTTSRCARSCAAMDERLRSVTRLAGRGVLAAPRREPPDPGDREPDVDRSNDAIRSSLYRVKRLLVETAQHRGTGERAAARRIRRGGCEPASGGKRCGSSSGSARGRPE